VTLVLLAYLASGPASRRDSASPRDRGPERGPAPDRRPR
jgi:hypothetical protein